MKAIYFGAHNAFSSINKVINYTILIIVAFVVTLVFILLLCAEISEYSKIPH